MFEWGSYTGAQEILGRECLWDFPMYVHYECVGAIAT